jgi:predicted SnoaL-like aldol condensation-catalyzing enzyme
MQKFIAFYIGPMEVNATFEKTKASSIEEHKQFVEKSPELKQLLHDFVVRVLEEKPQDVKQFAKQYFANLAGNGKS